MATHFSILAWRIPWREEPGGLPSIGLQRVRHDWSDLALSTQNNRNFPKLEPMSRSEWAVLSLPRSGSEDFFFGSSLVAFYIWQALRSNDAKTAQHTWRRAGWHGTMCLKPTILPLKDTSIPPTLGWNKMSNSHGLCPGEQRQPQRVPTSSS